jgi:hypothetical protein
VVLSVGILTTLFTALMGSRTVIGLVWAARQPFRGCRSEFRETIAMEFFHSVPRYRFMAVREICYVILGADHRRVDRR